MTRTVRTPSPRRRRRNLLLLAGLLPSVVATVVAVALLLMLARNAMGVAATDEGEHGEARGWFADNRWFGTVERWIAPYNEGVASYRDEDYPGALEDFLAALEEEVPPQHVCLVLHNIALTREQLADRAVKDDPRRAITGYRAGREALDVGECTELVAAGGDPLADRLGDQGGNGDGGLGPLSWEQLRESSEDTDERLAAKIRRLLERLERQQREQLSPQERERLERSEREQEEASEREQRSRDRHAEREEEPEPEEQPEEPEDMESPDDPDDPQSPEDSDEPDIDYGW